MVINRVFLLYLVLGLRVCCHAWQANNLTRTMNTYFYTDGTNKFGPFSLEELKKRNISKDTLVWTESMGENWAPAGTVTELAEWVAATPPAIVVPPSQPPATTQAGTYQQQQQQQQQGHRPYVHDVIDITDRPPRPKTWLVESILVTLFCCLFLGIPGIVFAAQVDGKYNRGDYQGAAAASKNAKVFTLISLILGVLFYGFYVLIFGLEFMVLFGALAGSGF